jgi:hypothetical protein
LTPNPILKVLSTLERHKVKYLLIGGQACIIYGAAEFSRDSDFAVLCTQENLESLRKALGSLKARLIYLPPLEAGYLEKGHACHFRCAAADVKGLRLDVISKLRGCEGFNDLWRRKKRIGLKNGAAINVICLQDLVASKKTQRDKDWLMVKRLVENDIISHKGVPTDARLGWWLRECRDARLLIELAKKYPKEARDGAVARPLLSLAVSADERNLETSLKEEETLERQRDVDYWTPLKKELESIRHRKNIS